MEDEGEATSENNETRPLWPNYHELPWKTWFLPPGLIQLWNICWLGRAGLLGTDCERLAVTEVLLATLGPLADRRERVDQVPVGSRQRHHLMMTGNPHSQPRRDSASTTQRVHGGTLRGGAELGRPFENTSSECGSIAAHVMTVSGTANLPKERPKPR